MMLKAKIGGVLAGKDQTLFLLGYKCEKAGVEGDWSGGAPPPPPDNTAPAFLLGRTTYWCDRVKQGLLVTPELLDLLIP